MCICTAYTPMLQKVENTEANQKLRHLAEALRPCVTLPLCHVDYVHYVCTEEEYCLLKKKKKKKKEKCTLIKEEAWLLRLTS